MNKKTKRKAKRVIHIHKHINIRKEVNIMEEKKKFNWVGLLIEVAKVVVSFFAGTQV